MDGNSGWMGLAFLAWCELSPFVIALALGFAVGKREFALRRLCWLGLATVVFNAVLQAGNRVLDPLTFSSWNTAEFGVLLAIVIGVTVHVRCRLINSKNLEQSRQGSGEANLRSQ